VYTSTKIEIARNTDATLRIQQSIPGQYELIDGATGDILQQNNSGDFVVRNVTSDRLLQVRYSSGPCISATTQISIKVFDDTRLTIPNAFTPNNDGVNDLFKIKVEGYFLLKYVRIYNRWGQLIYEFRDINLGWNGRKNAADLPVGTYYWVLEGIDVKNMPINRSGSVTLLR
jgi:gliding motility-associated-like protein